MKKLIVLFFMIFSIICIAGQIVYITPKGKKYHSTKSCKTLVRSKQIIEINISKVGGK